MPEPPTTVPGPTVRAPKIALARLGAVTRGGDQVSNWIVVDFNPSSLQLQISNGLLPKQDTGSKQYASGSSARLTMDLQFDSTDDGQDVTQKTRRLQALIAAPPASGETTEPQQPPPSVLFEWGLTKFKGVVESYKETIDFFSADGVPLRALVNLTLTRQEPVVKADDQGPKNGGATGDDAALDTPGGSAAAVANAAASPDAARGVAEANGQDSLRFGSGAPLTVGGSITLKPPPAFAAGGGLGISFGASGSLGIGLGGSATIGLSANAGVGGGGVGFSAGGTAGASLAVDSVPGLAGLSRLSATEGAFSALRAVAHAGASTARLDTSRLVPQAGSATLSTDRHAGFLVGGKATFEGAAGLSADVGAIGGRRRQLSFDDS